MKMDFFKIAIMIALILVVGLMAVFLPQLASNSDYVGGNVSGNETGTTNLTATVSGSGSSVLFGFSVLAFILVICGTVWYFFKR
jgi:hypothetical protein